MASLGKKTYRTRVIRHNLNPIFDERMLFQVLRHEQTYSLNFSVVDRDKLSGNDFVGTASIPLQDVVSTAPEADPETGLYRLKEPPTLASQSPATHRSRFRLPMSRSSSSTSLAKLSSRPSLKTQDSAASLTKTASQASQALAPTNAPSFTVGSQTSQPLGPPSAPSTMATSETPEAGANAIGLDGTENDAFDAEGDHELRPYVIPLALKNKDRWEMKHAPELFIRAKYVPYPALRQQFWRAILKQYDADESDRISKVELSTMLDTLGSTLKESTIDGFFQRFAEENGRGDPNTMELSYDQTVICLEDQLQEASRERTWGESLKKHMPNVPGLSREETSEPETSSDSPPSSNTPDVSRSHSSIPLLASDPLGPAGEEGEMLGHDDLADDKGEEHVVEIRECPICHQPRMKKKSDADIITHIATCASHDWRQVNNIVMAGFVTPSQAQRKWYSKVITKISYGGYRLGANSANILVQDRITGQINEERMSVYVRLGIRLLYKGLKSREMEKKRSKDPD